MEGKHSYGFDDIPPGRVRDELVEIADRYGYDLCSPQSPPRPLWRNMRRFWKTLWRKSEIQNPKSKIQKVSN